MKTSPSRAAACASTVSLTALAAVSLSLSATAAHAQETTSSSDDSAQQAPAPQPLPSADTAQPTSDGAQSTGATDDKDIVVTGSRVATGFTTPTPVTVTSSLDLKAAAPRNLADGLTQLPAFNGSLKDQTVVTAATGGTNGQALLNLRNLGPNRTLVLLDGRRLPASNSLGAVDVDVLPQSLVKRVDVVTGGASAAYGSDAVSGVVNFILDTKFEGLKGEVQKGISTYGDLPSTGASLAFGKSFADGRGRVIASAEWFRQDGIPAHESTGRDWFDNAAGQIPNPVTGAHPSILIIPDIRSSLGAYGGLISSGPLKGTQFLPGGIPAPFDYGTITGSSFQSGGDGAKPNLGLAPDVRRVNAFLHGEFDFSDHFKVFAEGNYARNHSISDNSVNPNTGTSGQFTIFRDNAYLPASILARMVTAGVQSIPLGRYERDFPDVQIETLTELKRGVVGARGSLFGSWEYDASYSYGQTNQKVGQNNEPILRRLYAAADAVVSPGSGQVVCRSTLAGLDPGCAPLNLFGEGSPSQAAINYVIGDSVKYLTLRQHVGALNFRGNFGDRFSFGAGPISLAFGFEYRHESASQTVDPLSPTAVDFTGIRGGPASLQGRQGAYQFFNPLPLSGSYDVKEGYAELAVPILKDLPFAKALDIDVAARHTIYSQSGGVTTWKGGVNYQINDSIRLRVTRSRDIRGPNILELFNSATQNSSNNIYHGVTTPSLIISSGNPNLLPEKADTLTYGAVFRPSFLRGFQASVDYYNIAVKDAIGSLNSQIILDNCAAGSAFSCSLFQVTSANTLIIFTQSLNLNIQKTSGYDFEVAYSHPVGTGQLSMRFLGNLTTDSYIQAPGSPVQQLLGGSLNPKFRGTGQLHYTNDHMSVFVQERFIGSAQFDPTKVEGIDIADNSIPPQYYTDLGLTVDIKGFGQTQELFLTVNNLFDRDPPIATVNPTSYSVPTTAAYDQLGRFFTVGLRFKL